MDGSDWIVLAVGAATIIAQVVTTRSLRHVAEREASAAEAQQRAAEAALENELAAHLVATFGGSGGGGSGPYFNVRIHNGGRHPASDIHGTLLDGGGNKLGEAALPMLAAGATTRDDQPLAFTALTEAARDAASQVKLRWRDGREDEQHDTQTLPH